MTEFISLADLCLYCGQSTAAGTPRFAGRVAVSIGVDEWSGWAVSAFPAGTHLSGWACSECMKPDIYEACKCPDCKGDCGGYIDREDLGLCMFCYQGDCRFEQEVKPIPEPPSMHRPYGDHLH